MFRRLRRFWSALWSRLADWRSAADRQRRQRDRQAGPKLLLEQLEERAHPNDLIGTTAAGAVAFAVANTSQQSVLPRGRREEVATTSSKDLLDVVGPLADWTPWVPAEPERVAPAEVETRRAVADAATRQQRQVSEEADALLDPLRFDPLAEAGLLDGLLGRGLDRGDGSRSSGGGSAAGNDTGSTSGDNAGGGGTGDDLESPSRRSSATPLATSEDDPFTDPAFLQQLGLVGNDPEVRARVVTTTSTDTGALDAVDPTDPAAATYSQTTAGSSTATSTTTTTTTTTSSSGSTTSSAGTTNTAGTSTAGTSTAGANSGGGVAYGDDALLPAEDEGTVDARLAEDYGKVPLAYTQNIGQTDPSVHFLSRGVGQALFLTDSEAVLALTGPTRQADDGTTTRSGDVLRLRFAGANADPDVVGRGQLLSRSNDYTGSDPDAWVTDAPEYSQVVYQDLYQGVDVVWHASDLGGRQFQFDYVVAAGADPDQIAFDLEGARSLRVDEEGNLVVELTQGEVRLLTPQVYQTDAAGERQTVQGRYELRGGTRVGFVVGDYDRGRDLVIDPTISWASYAAGSGADAANAVAVDAGGSVYVVGSTASSDFPVVGSSTYSGNTDVAVFRIDPDGRRLIFSAFLGGSSEDQGYGIAVDPAGHVYITGATDSANFPLVDAFDSTVEGHDVFVAKLSAAGDALLYSTLVGGSGGDYGRAIAVDEEGAAYVVGYTAAETSVGPPGGGPPGGGGGSTPFPTVNAFQGSPGGGITDAFAFKIDATSVTLTYSTFIGGGMSFGVTGDDRAYGVAVDGDGQAVVVGVTSSANFPTTTFAYQGSLSGTSDAFAIQLSASGSAALSSTYYGGSGDEAAYGVALDREGSLYFVGRTTSSDLPVTHAYQGSLGGGSDAFAVKLEAGGGSADYATYYGGSSDDAAYGVAVDAEGRVWVVGVTASSDLPVQGALQSLSGTTDAFVARFSASGTTLQFGTPLGGSSTDEARGVAVDLQGAVAVVGLTNSSDFPTQDPLQGSSGGSGDGWVAKIVPDPVASLATIANDTGTSATDRVTSDTTLVFYGKAPDGATVAVYDAGTLLGTTTAGAGDVWSFDYTGTALAEGYHAIQLEASESGTTGPTSGVYWVVVDTTAPTVNLTAAGTTTDKSPELRIAASDAVALAGTYALDVDLNNDNDFLDPGEANYLTGTLSNGSATVEIAPDLALGTYKIRVRARDTAGNEGASATRTIVVTSVGSPWTIVDTTVQVDPTVGDPTAAIGNLNALHTLDLDQSPGSGVGGDPVLSYNSSRVTVKPVVQVELQTDNSGALPASFDVVLTWDGTAQATVSYSTSGRSPGEVLTFAQQVASAVTTTGRYSWSVTISWSGAGSPVTVGGASFVVADDSSAYGAGWSYGPVDRLVDIAASGGLPAGKLRVFGWHSYAFYEETAPNTYQSPAGDDGTLTVLMSGNYLSKRADGRTWEFDSAGKLVRFTSADGSATITYTYTGALLTGIDTPDGGHTTLAYDGSSKLDSIEAPGGRTYDVVVDGSGDLVNLIDPDGTRRTLAYDADHKLTSDQTGTRQATFAYASGMLSSATVGVGSNRTTTDLTPMAALGLNGVPWAGRNAGQWADGLGRNVVQEMDRGGRPTTVTDPAGNDTVLGRNANGRIVVVTDAIGRTTTYQLDAQDYVVNTTFADSSTRSSTYGVGYHERLTDTDERGHTTTYSYDGNGRFIGWLDALGNRGTTTYNASGLVETEVDALGRTTSFAYDASRRLRTITDPAGGVQTYAYDAAGNVSAYTDANGNTTSYAYDLANRLVQTTDALGGVVTQIYNSSGQLGTVLDARGVATVYQYDERGLLVRRTEAAGTAQAISWLYQYDAAGQMVASRDPDGAWTTYGYDALGRVVSQTDALGGQRLWVYDAVGQLLATRDELGRVARNTYDLRGRVVTQVDALGYTTSLAYDLTGNLTQRTDALGLITSLAYDAIGRTTTRTEAYGTALERTATFAYDKVGNLVSTTDALGRVMNYGYDTLDRTTSVVEAAGTAVERTATFAYDKVGNLVSTTDALGRITNYGYDDLDRQTTTTEAAGTGLQRTTTLSYDAVGNVLSVTDPLNHTTSFGYDTLGRRTTTTEAVGTADERTTTVLYDALARPVVSIDALGHSTWVGYDLLGRAVARRDALGYLEHFAYDAAGNLVAVTDANGNTTRFGYDARNARTTTTDALGRTTTLAYDAVGNLSAVVEANGATTSFVYDVLHRHVATVDALGGRATVVYDAGDRVLATSDRLGNLQSYSYDERDRLVSTLSPEGHTATVVYDAADRVVAEVDADGNRTTLAYDVLDRLVSSTDALNHTTSFAYDLGDNLLAVTDANNHTTSFGYDALDRMVRTTDALGHVSTVVYDAADNVVRTVDALGRTTTLVYDVVNQVVRVVDALGQTTTLAYDGAGNTVAVTDALGHTTTLAYDALNRAVVTVDALGGRTTLAYDSVGNLVAVTDANGNTTSFGYDVLHRRTTTTDAEGYTTTLAYDAQGNVVSVLDARGNTTSFAYDRQNRIVSTTDALGRTTTVVYDAVGNVRATVDAANARTTFGYDAAHRQVSTTDALNQTSTLAYDAVGNLIASTDANNHTTSFGYDELNRTVTVTDALNQTTSFGYDAVGNTVTTTDALGRTTTLVYDALDRVVATVDALGGRATLVYDAVGNVVAATDENNHTTSFGYDALNRQVTTTDALGQTSTLAYDGVGNVVRTVDALGRTTTLAYDGRNLLVSVTDALGGITTLAYDANGNQVATTDANGHTSTVVYDALNRTVATVDAGGFRSTLAYDAVGNLVAVTDANNHTTSFGYDALHRRVSTTNALGETTTLVYDKVGNLVAVVEADGARTTLAYDAADRQVSSTDALNKTSTLAYDAVGNMVASTDANNHTTSFGYDALDRVVTVTDALGRTTTLAYDAVGNNVATTNARGYTTTVVYDELNRMVATVDALGGRATVVYDAVSNIVAVTDENNHTTSFGYDALDRQVTTTDALGKVSTLVYDAVGNVVRTIDANGNTTSFVYDSRDLLVNVVNAGGGTTTFGYDGVGNRITTINAVGTTTTVVYDALDRMVASVDGAGYRSTVVYDEVGNVVNVVDPLGRTTTLAYDAVHQLLSSTDPTGATTTFAYDGVGNQIATTNARGYTTTVVYDELDRTQVVVDALGGRTTLAYDQVGNLVAITDANSHTTSFGYDALDRQVSTTDALNHTSTVVYDGVGNTVATVDPLGYRTTLTYNARDELVGVLDAGGGITTLAYDNVGNRIATTDPNGNTTTQVYDSLHRVVQVIDAEGYTTTYQYDAIGRLTLQTDASGNTTTFAFDERNLLVRETDALGNAITFAYDAAGQLTSRTDRLGRRIDWAYDDAGRMRTEKWYSSGGALQQTQTFAYDAVGNLTTVTDPSGTLSYAYDALDRLVREDGLFGTVLTHAYDAVGNRTVRQDSWGGVETFSYDAADRLTSQRSTRNGSEAARLDYAYTDRDQVESVSRYTDLTATTLRGSSSFSYDAVGRETHFVHKDGSAATLSEGTYAYDVGGRLTEQVLDGTTTSFAYDQTDQLTSAGTLAYDYDGTGNRDSAGYSTTTGNRMEAAPGWTYAYDAEGNRTSKTNTSTGEYWTYTFNTGNRLVEVKKYSSAGGTLLLTVQYTYDAFGRRVQEVRTEGGTTTTRFVHDGDNLIADLDGTSALVRRYLGNGDIDDIRASVTAAGVLAWYLTDRQKSVVALTDASGAVQDRLVYDAFGNLVSESSPGYAGRRHGYTSKEFDAATQLQVNLHRWYDSVVGRWLSEDPTRWRGGDVNLTRYVGNSPTNATDPSGLQQRMPTQPSVYGGTPGYGSSGHGGGGGQGAQGGFAGSYGPPGSGWGTGPGGYQGGMHGMQHGGQGGQAGQFGYGTDRSELERLIAEIGRLSQSSVPGTGIVEQAIDLLGGMLSADEVDALRTMAVDEQTRAAGLLREGLPHAMRSATSKEALLANIKGRIAEWQKEEDRLQDEFEKYYRAVEAGLKAGLAQLARMQAATRAAIAENSRVQAALEKQDLRGYYVDGAKRERDRASAAVVTLQSAVEKGDVEGITRESTQYEQAKLWSDVLQRTKVPLEEFKITRDGDLVVKVEGLTDRAKQALVPKESILQKVYDLGIGGVTQRISNVIGTALSDPSIAKEALEKGIQNWKENLVTSVATSMVVMGASVLAASNPITAPVAAVAGYVMAGTGIYSSGYAWGEVFALAIFAETKEEVRAAAMKVVEFAGTVTIGVTTATLIERVRRARSAKTRTEKAEDKTEAKVSEATKKGVVPAIPAGRKKPPQSPQFKKWVDDGGTVEYIPEGVKYTNKAGVSVIYRKDRYPDFKGAGAVVEEVQIKMVGDHVKDYEAAKVALRAKGVPEARINELFDPNKYTPHHFEDQKTMQFVKADVHKEFRHQGSVSDIKHGRPPVIYSEE